MSPADAARLQNVYRRESVSLLLYSRSAAPHAAGPDRKRRDELFRAADVTATALAALGAYLDAHRIPVPPSGSFPAVFTDLNCVAVRYLAAKVAADRASAVTGLEADVSALADADARAVVHPLLELARRHRDLFAG